jgi:hypothetical protein
MAFRAEARSPRPEDLLSTRLQRLCAGHCGIFRDEVGPFSTFCPEIMGFRPSGAARAAPDSGRRRRNGGAIDFD